MQYRVFYVQTNMKTLQSRRVYVGKMYSTQEDAEKALHARIHKTGKFHSIAECEAVHTPPVK